VNLDKLDDLALVRGRLLEHVQMGGGNGEGKENLGREMKCVRKDTRCTRKEEKWRRRWGSDLGLGLNPLFIAEAMEGALNGLLNFT
jgi:hypothetical protein